MGASGSHKAACNSLTKMHEALTLSPLSPICDGPIAGASLRCVQSPPRPVQRGRSSPLVRSRHCLVFCAQTAPRLAVVRQSRPPESSRYAPLGALARFKFVSRSGNYALLHLSMQTCNIIFARTNQQVFMRKSGCIGCSVKSWNHLSDREVKLSVKVP